MVTIYDIAKKTGYTAPTISKALNGTGGLSQKTREHILDVACELGYRPNMVARTLTTKKSFLIGVIFEDAGMSRGFDHPLFGAVLNKFRAEVEAEGYDLIILSRSFIKQKISYVEYCHHRCVDAVLIVNPLESDDAIHELAESDIPCVSVNFIFPGIPTVVTENESAGYEAVSYLIKSGHRKIAYISGSYSKLNRAATERLAGMKRAFSEAGLEFDESYVEYCELWTRDDGAKAMRSLLARHDDITAVFASSDYMALGAMEYAKSAGKKIPDDISFIGFDDEMFAELYSPPLTTFRQKKDVIGEIAAEILVNRIAGIPVSKGCIWIPAEFIPRSSVSILS